VNIDEEIEANALRKLQEKTGVSGDFYVEQLFTWGNLNRDERGRVISVSYLGLVKPETYVNAGGAEKQTWMDVEVAMYMPLAFDHNEILKYAVERLRGKMEYTDIVFNLLPDEFTIQDIKAIYELLFNKKQDNFRRRIEKYVTPANKTRTGGQFRPAELYKWRKENKDE
jgi:8-oxo-dGTP diphosphatase